MEEEKILDESLSEADISDTGEADELETLRAEVASLRAELEEKKAMAEAVTAELAEFSELFPETDVKSLPEDVWEIVRSGNSLAASFALYQKKAEARDAQIRAVNEQNARMSSGKLSGGAAAEYFTPADVRAMSQSEVKANYTKIIESMKKWN